MATEAQRRANAKYAKEKVKQVAVKFYPTEADLIAYLETKGNKNGYIKSLIRMDMEGKFQGKR